MTTKQQLTQKESSLRLFLSGFSEGAQMPITMVYSHWQMFTKLLTDTQRLEIESGGHAAGLKYGQDYYRLWDGVDP